VTLTRSDAPPHRRARLLPVAGLAALSLIGVAGCGHDSGGGGQRHPAMQAYRQCLSQHGVTLPARQHGGSMPSSMPGMPGMAKHQPGTPPPGVNPDTWNSARTACASLAPSHAAKPSGGS
jgi:hypothetical protein